MGTIVVNRNTLPVKKPEIRMAPPLDTVRIVVFKWDKPGYRAVFTSKHVNTLRNMVARNTSVKHEFVCVTDNPKGIADDIRVVPIWDNPAPNYGAFNRPNCFVRLRMFSDEMREIIGSRFLWLDLDTVITGNINHILNDPAEFKIWRVDGELMPCNGSMVLHRAGTRQKIWTSFDANDVDPDHAFRRKIGMVGSDQAWIAQNLGKGDEFFGKRDGVYSFRSHILRMGTRLPSGARIVFFHGDQNPFDLSVQRKFSWVKEHYR